MKFIKTTIFKKLKENNNKLISKFPINFLPIIIICAFFILTACPQIVKLPEEPKIKFERIYLNDSIDILGNKIKKIIFSFNIIDGDGDIGYNEWDTTGSFHKDSTYYHNLFFKMYEKTDTNYQEIVFPTNSKLFFRIPNLTPQGQNKTLDAIINIDFNFEEHQFNFDTIIFKAYLADRKFNLSNTIQSPNIPCNFLGTITDSTQIPIR